MNKVKMWYVKESKHGKQVGLDAMLVFRDSRPIYVSLLYVSQQLEVNNILVYV